MKIENGSKDPPGAQRVNLFFEMAFRFWFDKSRDKQKPALLCLLWEASFVSSSQGIGQDFEFVGANLLLKVALHTAL